jgi:hypothetical protein
MVMQTVQLCRERYAEDVIVVQQLTHVANSSMFIKHITNPVQHREEDDQRIED